MEVVISEAAKAFVQARGGTVYVRADERRCCGGALVLLDASTNPPRDASGFTPFPADDVDVFYRGHPRGIPGQLVIELRGVLRPRLAAYKDGCVFPL